MAVRTLEEVMSSPQQDNSTFFEAVVANNPFAMNRVSDPSHMDCDVPAIHAAEFTRLTELADEALRNETGRGALLLGSAGTGKSHVLARLSRWAADRKACFVYLHNIQVRPDDMSRYLLKACISRLAEDRLDRLHDTPLFRIVGEAVRKAAADEKIVKVSGSNWDSVYRRLAKRLHGEETVFEVIFRFFYEVTKSREEKDSQKRQQHKAFAALTVRWLKGEFLDAEEAKQLKQKVRPGDEVAELADEQVEPVLLTIARLARVSDRPFVLCIDQADNMKTDQLTALCKSLHSLIDHAANLLVVVSGVREDMLQLIDNGVITAAAADRLNYQRPLVIHRIKRLPARQLLQERLTKFLEKFALPAENKPFFLNDDLFPLGSDWFERTEPASVELRPRDVLTWANDRWREIQNCIRVEGGEAWLKNWKQVAPIKQPPLPPAELHQLIERKIDEKVADKVAEMVNARRLQPGNLPADAGNLLGLTTQLLEQCLNRNEGYSLESFKVYGKQKVDLIVGELKDGNRIANHVEFVVTSSKTSAAHHLRKLLNSPQADYRILVTDEDRAPLQLGAKGQEYLDDLLKLGSRFLHIRLSFEHYAQLDAMMSVVGEARSGDLEIEPQAGQIQAVKESQVIDSHHRQDRYRQHPLLQHFLTEPSSPPPVVLPQFLPVAEFRAFVHEKLLLLTGSNMIELTKGFMARQAIPEYELSACLAAAKEFVMQMHAEGLVSAKPWDNDLFLTLGTKA